VQNLAYSISDAINTFSIHGSACTVTFKLGERDERVELLGHSVLILKIRYKITIVNLDFTHAEIQHLSLNLQQYENDKLTVH
jgi:hypothetical protein